MWYKTSEFQGQCRVHDKIPRLRAEGRYNLIHPPLGICVELFSINLTNLLDLYLNRGLTGVKAEAEKPET